MTTEQQELQRRLDECRSNQLTKLDISSLGLIELHKDLPMFTWLTELWCFNNEISDLSSLAGLSNLAVLLCNDNIITDLSPLADLSNLTELYFSNNRIADLSPLASLTKLRVLYCSNNLITDIKCLSHLPLLKEFHYPKNYIAETARFVMNSPVNKPLDAVITITFGTLLAEPLKLYATKDSADNIARTLSLLAANTVITITDLDDVTFYRYKNGEGPLL